jgi:hypothetical protein
LIRLSAPPLRRSPAACGSARLRLDDSSRPLRSLHIWCFRLEQQRLLTLLSLAALFSFSLHSFASSPPSLLRHSPLLHSGAVRSAVLPYSYSVQRIVLHTP